MTKRFKLVSIMTNSRKDLYIFTMDLIGKPITKKPLDGLNDLSKLRKLQIRRKNTYQNNKLVFAFTKLV